MKKSLFLLSAAAMLLCGCNNSNSVQDRAEVPTDATGVVEKVASSAILIDTSGNVMDTAKVNELPYGKILNPAVSWRLKAKIEGVTYSVSGVDSVPGADKNGEAYVSADIEWTFDEHWKTPEKGPDDAHKKVKGNYPKDGEDPIDSTAKCVITFGGATKEVTFQFKMFAYVKA